MVRRTELDALRGLLLVMMALTHLPTRMSAYANQPLGFVSAAEGFVFLSAFVAGSSYSASVVADRAYYWRNKLWLRTLRLYAYHIGLLVFAFTIAAAFAALTGRPALRNLLTFYFDSPVTAIISGPLLLYQPPLFDILPMYIVFLGLTPLLLDTAAKRGWTKPLILSLLIWVFAQLGGRRLLYESFVPLTGVQLPFEAVGAFDMLAWQLLWVAGLRAGAGAARSGAWVARPWPVVLVAASVAATFLFWRHGIGSFWTALDPAGPLLDKWHLGALRIANFAVLAVVARYLLLPLLRWLRVSVLALLGRASLQVFTAHLLVCVGSLGLIVDDDTPLTLAQEGVVLLLTFATMVFVAKRVAARDARTERRAAAA